MHDDIARRIKQARDEGSTALDLSGNQLTALPSEIGQLTTLLELRLGDNQLTVLPPEIGQLIRLQILIIWNNPLMTLPPEIGQLADLTTLSIADTTVAALPPEIGQLISLEVLYLDNNQLTALPPEIGQLASLKELVLSGSQLRDLPPEIGRLTNLRELNLSGSRLNDLPPEMGQLTNLQDLRLGGNQLTVLPPEIGQMTTLLELRLGDNQLSALPSEIGQLTSLITLNLRDNQLSTLPPQISQLTNLRTLYLGGNTLTALPPGIGQLANLHTLDLADNQLSALPSEIGQMTNLQTLNLRLNQLTVLPPEIGQLTNLQNIDLGVNQVTNLPPEIGQLTNLQHLDLRYNQLTDLPPETGQLANLEELDLDRNRLKALPAQLGQLAKLERLPLAGNSLTSPPPEIVSQGTAAILAYLREQLERGRRQWVSKLLVVGEGGAGKSAMLRSLHGEPFDPALSTTHGIQVDEFSLPHPTQADVTMTLNTWDFGGQQIGHATHQFFLTNRSLFVLVWNARHGYEQAKLEYWLDIIHAKAPDSPIVIVATHIDEWDADLPLADLCARYPQIATHCAISNATGEGIDALREALTEAAAHLPLMGERWPATWLNAVEAIRGREDKHTTAYELFDAIAGHGVQASDAPILARWMHELGDILYFEDDPELKDLVILKPQWVASYITRVLRSEEVADNNGVFTQEHMHRLWSDLPPVMRDHFLRLMERFDLSYRTLDNREISLVVERLSLDPADYEPQWDAIGEQWPRREIGIRFRMHTIPPGIPTWFIARSHRFTTHTHWRFGALFADSGHRHLALVRTVAHDRYLDLTVRGPCPHNFLTLLRDGIEVTLNRFPGLDVERTIPCPGHKGQPCKHEFNYEHLQRAIERDPPVRHIQCPVSFEDVPVAGLLFGLHWRTHGDVLDRLDKLSEATACRLDDLLSLVQREFAKQFRREQEFGESHCPPAFVLRPLGARAWRESLVGQRMELQLYCQAPGEWHPTCEKRRRISGNTSPQTQGYDIDIIEGPSPEAGQYVIDDPAEWLKAVSPVVRNVVKVLKYVAPLAGPFVGVALPQYEKLLEDDIDLMDELVKKLPAIEEAWAADLADDIGVHGPASATGAPLRALRKLLDEKDKNQTWGGLRKVLTPEHHYLWLCEYHAREYEV